MASREEAVGLEHCARGFKIPLRTRHRKPQCLLSRSFQLAGQKSPMVCMCMYIYIYIYICIYAGTRVYLAYEGAAVWLQDWPDLA